jgi:(1->4)-alpha-D-glucan 1-alpha-D-glucosylmutase
MPPAIPIATYRLQFTPSFGFDDAAAILPYLKALGVSHLYASPFLKARAGSTHGYDIIDHNAINPEIGGEDGFRRLSDRLAQADMGLILDFVPNHMGVHNADNAWWLDVLEWGQKSPHAASFDIEWDMLPERRRSGVLLPILSRSYGEVLEDGEIELRYDAQEGGFSAWYFQHRLPIEPTRYGEILQRIVAAAGAENEPAGRRLIEIAARYHGPRNPTRDKAPEFKAALAAVNGGAEVIERGMKAYRPKTGEPGALLALHHLLERQHYRLAYWRLAGTEINYRRFFDINSLAGLRVENAPTFKAIHQLVARLIGEGRLQGLRLDHIDGLRNPQQYLRDLRRLIRSARPAKRRTFYRVVEKILAEGERLPKFPGVAGTTGYEWLNVISHLLLNDGGLAPLDTAWREATGDNREFGEILTNSKRRVLTNLLASEFMVLARLLARIAAGHYSTRDYAAERLREAFEDFVLYFPVYRTYITGAGPSAEDRAIIEETIAKAQANWFGPDADIFNFLHDALTLDLVAPGRSGHSKSRVRRFAFKVQQLTGPVMAKSMEDTAFYRYHRLLALNEVGGDPAAGAITVEEFHQRMLARADTTPHGMTATATHDTKRGEDARTRLLALSELAGDWAEAVPGWRRLNANFAASAGRTRVPSPAHEYMLYQALLGAWPLEGVEQSFVARMQAYAVKVAREGKEQTSWLAPHEAYESGLMDFLARILSAENYGFLQSFDGFARRAALLGALSSLTQVALKGMMPGVPDFYQGTEFWDLSLVDPDNRRPVDFSARAAALQEVARNPDWPALARDWHDGRIKLALTHRVMAIRRQFETIFTQGSYRPLEVTGPHKEEVLAFARLHGRKAIIVVAGRLFGRVTDGGRLWPAATEWEGITLSVEGFSALRRLLAAGKSAVGPLPSIDELFHCLPVAILAAEYS